MSDGSSSSMRIEEASGAESAEPPLEASFGW